MSKQNYPAEGCKATKEGLIENGFGETKYCPICQEDFNIICRVSNHPTRVQALSVQGKLRDGFPRLIQNLTKSPPSIPTEKEHAPCARIEMDIPFLARVSEEVLNAPNVNWRDSSMIPDMGRSLFYASETDIAHLVKNFLVDISIGLQIKLSFSSEVTIKQIRPELCVLLMNKFVVGVVEIKKPGNNILHEPTVLGELLDQMLLVEGFYGIGPVIGILTTGEDWLISWFPDDTNSFTIPKSTFSTPVKSKSLVDTEEPSLIGRTPTQQSGHIHFIDDVEEIEIPLGCEAEEGLTSTKEMDRLLYTSVVMSIHDEPIVVLEHLCGAFQFLSLKTNLHQKSCLSRCLLQFHKDSYSVTFHAASYETVYSTVNFNKFPKNNVQTLIALEDLGRGSNGKAWLCVTASKPTSAVCVLKFDNNNSYSLNLQMERDLWILLYPEFSSMIRLEFWSGAQALVMPHFATILEEEREQYKEELLITLTQNYTNQGKIHTDVRWTNIGKYKKKNGEIALVLFDLQHVKDYNADIHYDWIDKALTSLFRES